MGLKRIPSTSVHFALVLHSLILKFAFMKLVALLLATYILALNLSPCEDGSFNDDSCNSEQVQGIDTDHNHGDFDLCSPFCTCHCCHVHATYSNLADLSIVSNDIATDIFLHFDSLGKDIPNSILQPPRV